MNSSVLILIVSFAVIIIAGIAGASSAADRRRRRLAMPGRFGPPGQHAPLPEQLVERVRARLRENKKILAIKEVREATGLGLKEAKDLVEAVEEGRPAPHLTGGPGLAGMPGAGLAERARSLKTVGDTAAAVQLVRAETGMSEAEAESFVAALGS